MAFSFSSGHHSLSPVAIGRLVPPTHDSPGRHWAVIVLSQSFVLAAGSWCARLLFISAWSLLVRYLVCLNFRQAPARNIGLQNDWCRTPRATAVSPDRALARAWHLLHDERPYCPAQCLFLFMNKNTCFYVVFLQERF